MDDSPVAVPEANEKTLKYYHSGNIIWLVVTLWGLILPLIFLFTGLTVFLRKRSERISRKKFINIFIYIAAFTIIVFVINFPISYYTEFIRPHKYGLSEQSLGKWSGDSFKSIVLEIFIGGLLINLFYLVLRKSPNRWWLYFGLLYIPFAIIMSIISPVFIAPLFQDFAPMKNKNIRE